MTEHVYARSTIAACAPGGVPVTMHEGEVWAKDDPLVIARPELFTDNPTLLHRSVRLEQATRSPGEARQNTRR